MLQVEIRGPESFRKDACSYPNFLVVGMHIVQLTPHTGFSSNNVDIFECRLNAIYLSPSDVGQVISSIVTSKANVKIGLVVIWQDHLIGSTCENIKILVLTPPLNNVIILNRQVNKLVGPVDSLFGGNSSPYLFLFLPVHYFKCLVRWHIIVLHPLFDGRFAIPAFQFNLISTKMNVRILKGLISIFHHLFDQVISFVKSWIKLPIILIITFYHCLLILITSTPTLSVAGGINFNNYSYSSIFCKLYDLLDFRRGVSSSNFTWVAQFRNWRDFKGERIWVNDVPMKDVHFVEHKAGNSFFDGWNWKKMSGSVDH